MLSLPRTAIPDWGKYNPGTSIGSIQLNASYTKVAFVVQVPKLGSITHINFATKDVASSQPIRVGVYAVNVSTGLPYTVYGGSAYGTLSAPAADSAQTVPLVTPANVSAMDIVAIVFEWDGPVGNVRLVTPSLSNIVCGLPMRCRYTAGTWSKYTTDGAVPTLWFTYADGSSAMPAGCSGGLAITNSSVNRADSPDEFGTSFRPNVDLRVTGIVVGNNSVSDPILYNIYNGYSLTSQISRPANLGSSGLDYLLFDRPIVLKAGSAIHFTVQPATSTAYIYSMTYCSELAKNLQHNDSSMCWCQRTDAGVWSYIPDKLLMLSILVDGIEIPINRRTSTGR